MNLYPYPYEASLDEESGEVTLVFVNGPEEGDPDPVRFVADKYVTVVLPGASVADIT